MGSTGKSYPLGGSPQRQGLDHDQQPHVLGIPVFDFVITPSEWGFAAEEWAMSRFKQAISHSHLLSLEGGINRWGVQIMGATSWNKFYNIATIVLGPECFNLGVISGMAIEVGNTLEDLHKLLNLAKTFAKAALYEMTRPGNSRYLMMANPQLYIELQMLGAVVGKPPEEILAQSLQLFMSKQELRAAYDEAQKLITEIGVIAKNPKKFFGDFWDSNLKEFFDKLDRVIIGVLTPGLTSKFEAGEAYGELFVELLILIATLVDGAGLVLKGAKIAGRFAATVGRLALDAAKTAQGATLRAAREAVLIIALERDAPTLMRTVKDMTEIPAYTDKPAADPAKVARDLEKSIAERKSAAARKAKADEEAAAEAKADEPAKPRLSTEADRAAFRKSYGAQRYAEDAEWIDKRRPDHPEWDGIPEEDLVAMRGYTSSDHWNINQALRSGDPGKIEPYSPYIKCATSGLDQLPGYTDTVTRGATLTDEQIGYYAQGSTVPEKAFMSTSKDPSRAFGGNTIFTVESISGSDVSKLSYFPTEEEVLFPPGTPFKVLENTFDPVSKTTFINLVEVGGN